MQDYFNDNDMEDCAEEAINNPIRFLLPEHISSRDVFRTMEAFIKTVSNKKFATVVYTVIRLEEAI